MKIRTYSRVPQFVLSLLGFFLAALPGLGESVTYTFTTVDFPNGGTTLYGLNNAGQIVGSSNESFGCCSLAILDSGGTFTDISIGFDQNWAAGINNSGSYIVNDHMLTLPTGGDLVVAGVHKAVFDPSNIGCCGDTFLNGINDLNQVVGATDADYLVGHPLFGFIYNNSNSSFARVSYPGFSDTVLNDINNSGVIVGDAFSSSDSVSFILSAGIFTPFTFSGASGTALTGINNSDQIVGSYTVGSVSHGLTYIDGVATTLDVPGATSTYLVGINDKGVIAGNYIDATGQHGFLATPIPEPSTISSVCLALFLLWQFRKKMNRMEIIERDIKTKIV